MDRDQIIGKLKSLAPFIYDITMSYDMGYEFSAISKKGQIIRDVGMLLSTEFEGHLPEWFSDERDQVTKEKIAKYLENFEIIPFDAMSKVDLLNLLAEIEDAISR